MLQYQRAQSPGPVRVSFVQGVGVGPRLLATIVDAIIIGVVAGIIGLFIGTYIGDYATGVEVLIALAYYMILEAIYGATLGKKLFHLRVVRIDGRAPIGWNEAFLRTVMRVVDVLPFFYIVGAISIWATMRNQRLGDLVAHTIVIRD